MSSENQNKYSYSIQQGLTLGLISIILTTIGYLFLSDSIKYFGVFLPLLMTILSIFFMYKSGQNYRNKLGGFMTFSQGLLPIYVTSVVASILSYLYGLFSKYILFKKEYQAMLDASMEKQLDNLSKHNLSEEQIDQVIKSTEQLNSFMDFIGLPLALTMGIILAVIIAAILSRRNPQESYS